MLVLFFRDKAMGNGQEECLREEGVIVLGSKPANHHVAHSGTVLLIRSNF